MTTARVTPNVSRQHGTGASRGELYGALFFGVLYAVVLVAVAWSLPLRADEVLPLYTFQTGRWHDSWRWIAMVPGSTVLFSFSQWPLVWFLGHAPLIPRIVSVASAVGSLAVTWRIARFAGIRTPLAVLILFAFLPAQYFAATTARAPEESVFLLLLATLVLLRLSVNPSLGKALAYTALLTATIYADPFSYAAAVGYLVFFFRFVTRPVQRRAFWFALGGTVIALIAYFPYYAWAAPKVLSATLPPLPGPGDVPGQIWLTLAGSGLLGTATLVMLIAASIAALWPSFFPRFPVEWAPAIVRRNISSFVLFGGALGSIVFAAAYASATFTAVTSAEVLAALPLLVLLTGVAIEYYVPGAVRPIFAGVLAAAVLALSLPGDIRFTENARTPDLQALADAAWPGLTSPDSCVVFVSEGLSRPLFFVLSPKLQGRECRNFFHKTVVLEIHPYVSANQREDALSFFAGLGFRAASTQRMGNGQVITLSQSATTP